MPSFRPRLEALEDRVLLANDFFTVPGAAGQTTTLRFDWTLRDASFHNEIGVYVVDNARGEVGGVAPGDTGYLRAVLNSTSRQIVFDNGAGQGNHRTLSFAGHSLLAFYMIQNNSTPTLQFRNSHNVIGKGPVAFFSVDAANKDNFDHVVAAGLGGGSTQFAWEDLTGGGDRDFNDVVFRVRPLAFGAPAQSVQTRGRALMVPGAAGQTVPASFRLNGRHSTTLDEVGLYVADDPYGRIGTLNPGDAGYQAAALARRQLLFALGQPVGTVKALDLPGGGFVGLYIIRDGTTEQFLASNPNNNAGGGPLAFFSFLGANPDHFDHLRLFGDHAFAFEDGLNGGDQDFDDVELGVFFDVPHTGVTDTAAPVIAARLANDTGLSATDRLTNDATVTGTVTDATGVASLRAGLGNTPTSGFTDVTNTLQPGGAFTLSSTLLRTINGGTLPDGAYTLHLQARDTLGNLSNVFDVTFTLDTASPSPLTLDFGPGFDTQTQGDFTTTRNNVTLVGQTTASTRVELVGRNVSSTSDASGNFSFSNVVLAAGANVITVRATDAAGNTRDTSRTFTLQDAPFVSQQLADVTETAGATGRVINVADNFAALETVNTLARIDTVLGPIDLELYDIQAPVGGRTTPLTVANFLNNYVNDNDYQNTIIHRSSDLQNGDPFVIQGGGFTFSPGNNPNLPHVPQAAQVPNEPGNSNLRGTLAMAKLGANSPGGGPDSATSEWFVNLSNNGNNSAALDTQNGGFTVFATVTNNTMTTADAIAALHTHDYDIPANTNAFGELPLRTGPPDPATLQDLTANDLVIVNNVGVQRRSDQLTFTVTVDNPAATPNLVTATVDPLNINNLNLTYAAGQTGTATVTVRATQPGGAFVEDSFTVTIS